MLPETALARTVRDEDVPVMLRFKALQAREHPSLDLLRGLLVRSHSRKNPVPKRLVALALIRYAQECKRRAARLAMKKQRVAPAGNALGV